MGHTYATYPKEYSMTLFKQFSIIMSIFLFVLIASVMTLDFRSTTKYAQEELYSNAQNTTASLSLSLANAQGDIPTISTMINAVFDSGYYKKISLTDRNGDELYSREKEGEETPVPTWFLNLFTLNVQSASAHVSSGWKPVGILEVTVLEESAYIKLYESFNELLKTFIIISLITSLLLYLLLRLLLHSLTQVKIQAEAIGRNDFIINEKVPYTTEFKEVTLSMNKMVSKVKHIFEQEAEAVKGYHKLLYSDPVSGFGNRKYFELKLKNMIHAEDISSHGVLLNLYFEGMQKANKELGHDHVDQLIKEFSELISKSVSVEAQAIKARLDGTKFIIIFPTLYLNDIKSMSDDLLEKLIVRLQHQGLDTDTYPIRLSAIEYNADDTVSGLIVKVEETISITEPNSVCIVCTDTDDINKDLKEKKELLKETLENRNISLALQPVFDKEMKVYHREAYIRLIDEQKNVMPAATFMPLVHQMGLDIQLDKQIITYAIKYVLLTKQALALNVSLPFIKERQTLPWLKDALLQSKQALSFELSNHDLLTCIQSVIPFAKSIQESGHIFGIDHFTADGTNLNYLQVLKPSYIKIDSHYLHDMLCDQSGKRNNALQILINSLDIKIIATSLEDEKVKDDLLKAGITHFQGGLLANPQML